MEELFSTLSKIGSLRVAARSSVLSLKKKEADVRQIGEELGVDTVLEGSVRKVGNRLRISVQLLKVSHGDHIWSEQYNREQDDVLTIQENEGNRTTTCFFVTKTRRKCVPPCNTS